MGEAVAGERPVNVRPAERPSQGGLGPVPKRSRLAQRLWIIPLNGLATGEPDEANGPVTILPGAELDRRRRPQGRAPGMGRVKLRPANGFATGDAEKEKAPVDVSPAERARHGWPAPVL